MTTNSTYLLICGLNSSGQLGEKSNNESEGCQIISPPCKSHLDISTLSSYSIYSNHAVWATLDGKAYAIGDNSDKRINESLPATKLTKETEIRITDSDGVQCKIISAVCGNLYTLYLVSQSNGANQLAYVCGNTNNCSPLFVSINGREPISLFGGYSTAAAIDADGGIIPITSSLFTSSLKVKSIFLPDGKKAVNIACMEKFFIAIDESGQIFESEAYKLSFHMVPELPDAKIIDISGKHEYCIAVCSDGRVFVRGSDYYGALGLGKSNIETDKFKEIESLRKYKIVSAYAGNDHSLFQTENGLILACGSNKLGELLLNSFGKENIYVPIETTIVKGASFCIASQCLSAVFIGSEIPSNIPNKKVVFKNKQITMLDLNSKSKMTKTEKNTNIQSENNESTLIKVDELKKEIEEKNLEITRLLKKNQELRICIEENNKEKERMMRLIDDLEERLKKYEGNNEKKDDDERQQIVSKRIGEETTSFAYKEEKKKSFIDILLEYLPFKNFFSKKFLVNRNLSFRSE